MKKYILSIIIGIFTTFLIAGCVVGPPFNSDSEGEITLAFDLTYPKSLGYDISQVHVTLTHQVTGTVVEEDLTVDPGGTSASGTIKKLRPGMWDLLVELYEGATLIGSGTGEFEIRPGETTRVTVRMRLDTGDLEIIVIWEDEFVPTGEILFVTDRDKNREVYIMEADGSNQQNLTNYPSADDYSPAWSPDHTMVAFVSDRDGDEEIYIMDLTGVNPLRQLTNNTLLMDYDPAWSPDGTKIAYASGYDDDGYQNIHVIDLLSIGSPKNLSDSDTWDSHPTWSPDGKHIAFARFAWIYENTEIMVMDADGQNQTNISNFFKGEDFEPEWSPDGLTIAFTRDNYDYTDIFLLEVKNPTNQTPLTNSLSNEYNPAWSPDSSKIIFSSDVDGDAEIYVMDVMGLLPTLKLTDNEFIYDFEPVW